MARTVIRSKPKKKRVRISFRQRAEMHKKVVKKDSIRNDTLQKAPFIMNDNGLNMRIKIRRKAK